MVRVGAEWFRSCMKCSSSQRCLQGHPLPWAMATPNAATRPPHLPLANGYPTQKHFQSLAVEVKNRPLAAHNAAAAKGTTRAIAAVHRVRSPAACNDLASCAVTSACFAHKHMHACTHDVCFHAYSAKLVAHVVRPHRQQAAPLSSPLLVILRVHCIQRDLPLIQSRDNVMRALNLLVEHPQRIARG